MEDGKAIPLMIQGTSSDAGKSLLVTAFCRIFAEEGYKTAPFKSQNMSLNSYITPDGKEIGRAQGVQAEAAGIAAVADMNPILIKPSGDAQAQIVELGKPIGNLAAAAYREEYFQRGFAVIQTAYARLSQQYERIVLEGAGSPAEINLSDRELVNMRVARMADAPVILVADIDRGGVFASIVGTLQLLEPADRERVIGVIINKFRGDRSLLQPGLDWLEFYTGKPVLGVMPYLDNLWLDSEDSLSIAKYQNRSPLAKNINKGIEIAVIQYPRISNFTDIDPFMTEPDCHVRFVTEPAEFGHPDLLILPGSKNTIEDLLFVRENGLEQQIVEWRNENPNLRIIGICGGYQMMGRLIRDPLGIESTRPEINGLDLIPLATTLHPDKTTLLSEGIAVCAGHRLQVKGYEIHMGQSEPLADTEPFIRLQNREDGFTDPERKLIGTYFHGIFHNDEFRHMLLNDIRKRKNLPPLADRVSFESLREESYRRLAEQVRQHVDVARIHRQMIDFFNRRQERRGNNNGTVGTDKSGHR